LLGHSIISCSISKQLRCPVVETRFRILGEPASRMLMPEATVDEDRPSPTCKDDVGAPRPVTRVGSEPITQSVKKATNCELRLSVCALHATEPLSVLA
jgi:hypothetical protein